MENELAGVTPTAPIGAKATPIHELTLDELNGYWVSTDSQFRDMKWSFLNRTPGAKAAHSVINWDMTLIDGSKLSEVRHQVRLHWAKLLMLSILVLPAKGRIPSPGAYGGLQNELNTILSWMSLKGYHSPDEFTPDVVGNYIDELPEFVALREYHDDADDEGIGVSVFDRALNPLMRLWDQRNHLALFGVQPLREHPFDGNGAHSVAVKLATRARGWIMPLPDEVCIPLFNTAAWWLGTPADDVIKLLGVFGCSGINDRADGKAKKDRLFAENKFLSEFEFSFDAERGGPWRAQLIPRKSKSHGQPAMSELRQMFESVRDAATITVQGTSGMRVSELCGLQAGIDADTGLPVGVRLERSLTGLYEWFVVRSELSKTKEGAPREVDWVLGMRPVGELEIPIAVKALVILNRIFAPWRAAARATNLLLAGRVSLTLPRPSTSLNALGSDNVRRGMRSFLKKHVDLSSLPDESARKVTEKDLVRWRESEGSIFTTHMLRKSWANFTLACDSRLLPVIQMQFHHLSIAMTEGGYIGNNPVLLEALDSVSKQRTNRSMYELIMQQSAFAGRMGAHLEGEAEKLRSKFAGLSPSERWTRTVEWVAENQLKMFFSLYATCVPLKRSEMRCHDESETPIWIRHEPDTTTREPSLCAGCANALMDKSHQEFWIERHVGYAVAVAVEKKLRGGVPTELRVIEFRALQSLAILKKMGADLSLLALRVEEAISAAIADCDDVDT